MRLQMDVRELAKGVWSSELAAEDLAVVDMVAKPALRSGNLTVLMLTDPPTVRDGQILFTPSTMKVLNRGSTRHAVIVLSVPSSTAEAAVRASGDAQFEGDLPPALRQLGTRLMADVRHRWPGSLQATSSGRFVDAPDNFWTVKIQPRDGSLRITVRGEPDRLHADPALNLKRDRPGYSTFKISETAQLQPTLDVLQRARRR